MTTETKQIELESKLTKQIEYTQFDDSNDIDVEAGGHESMDKEINNILSPELIAAYDDEHRLEVCHKCQFRSIFAVMFAFIIYKIWFIFYSSDNIVTEYKYISSDTTLMPAIMIQSAFYVAFIANISISIIQSNSYELISDKNMDQTLVEYNGTTLNINEHEINREKWNVIFFDYVSNWDNNTFSMYDTVWIIPPENYGIAPYSSVNLYINHGISPELVNIFYDLHLNYNDMNIKNNSWKLFANQYFEHEDIFGLNWVPIDSNYLFEYGQMAMSEVGIAEKQKNKKHKGPIWSFIFSSTENRIYYDLIEQIDETAIFPAIFNGKESEPLRMFTASNTGSVESGDILIDDECHIFSNNKSKTTQCIMYDTVLNIRPNPTSQGMNARIIIKHKIEMKELPEIIGGFFHLLERCLEAWIFIPFLFGTICGLAVCRPCGYKGYAPNKSLSEQQKHEILLFLQELDVIDSATSQVNRQKIKAKYQNKSKGICG